MHGGPQPLLTVFGGLQSPGLGVASGAGLETITSKRTPMEPILAASLTQVSTAREDRTPEPIVRDHPTWEPVVNDHRTGTARGIPLHTSFLSFKNKDLAKLFDMFRVLSGRANQ